jgi:hypothetical protein
MEKLPPLDGIVRVSLEQAVAASFCSSRLADAGARVIKVEGPEGDFARGYDGVAAGQNSHFVWLNRGKESVVLDLTSSSGKRAFAHFFRMLTFSSRISKAESARVGISMVDIAAGITAYSARCSSCGRSRDQDARCTY